MRNLKLLIALFSIILVASVCSSTAKADEWNKKTTVTFSGPVDVSGHRLEAGTYVFKLADSSDRHVVQIFSADEKHVFATILAMPDYRVTPTDKTTIRFSEAAGDVATTERELPQAGIPIKEWFYPGDNFGQEFRVKAAPAVAMANPTPTPATSEMNTEPTPQPSPEEKTVDQPEEKPVAASDDQPEPEPAVATPQQSSSSDSTPASTSSTDKSEKTTPSELPQTASSLPLIGLIGLGSLGIGLSLRQIAKLRA